MEEKITQMTSENEELKKKLDKKAEKEGGDSAENSEEEEDEGTEGGGKKKVSKKKTGGAAGGTASNDSLADKILKEKGVPTNLALSKLMRAAIKEAGEGAGGRSEQENRDRYSTAVGAVLDIIEQSATEKGRQVADKALSKLSKKQDPAELHSVEAENLKLKREVAELRTTRDPDQNGASNVDTSQKKAHKGVLTQKQEMLMDNLDGVVKMGKQRPPTLGESAEVHPMQSGSESESFDDQLGELERGALLVPAQGV